jgi:hypothetical protein
MCSSLIFKQLSHCLCIRIGGMICWDVLHLHNLIDDDVATIKILTFYNCPYYLIMISIHCAHLSLNLWCYSNTLDYKIICSSHTVCSICSISITDYPNSSQKLMLFCCMWWPISPLRNITHSVLYSGTYHTCESNGNLKFHCVLDAFTTQHGQACSSLHAILLVCSVPQSFMLPIPYCWK